MPRELQAVLVLLLVLALGWAGYSLLFGDDGGRHLVVASVEGRVRRVDGLGAEGDAAVGQELSARDRIVAGAGARAVLALGPESRVTLEESSALQVVAVDQTGVRLELEGGKVQATVRPGSGQVGLSSGGRSFVAEDADFTAVRSADGTVGVVTDRGSVSVEGVEGAASVGAGERLVAAPGGSALVAPASEDLLLSVDWPAAARTRDEGVEVRGTTEPGATVRVGRDGAWAVVTADAKGVFRARAPLTEGSNDLRVEATSVLGTSVAAAHTVVRDTTPPSVGVEVHY